MLLKEIAWSSFVLNFYAKKKSCNLAKTALNTYKTCFVNKAALFISCNKVYYSILTNTEFFFINFFCSFKIKKKKIYEKLIKILIDY